MTLEQLFWVFGLLLVALTILGINDRTKPKGSQKTLAKRAPRSARSILIGVAAVASLIGLSIACAREVPHLRWSVRLAFIGIILVVLVFQSRKPLWLCLISALTGRFPRVITRNAKGQLEMKCPHCSCRVQVSEGRTGEAAFECPHCGEKGTWTSEMTP